MRLALFVALAFVACAAGQLTPKLPGTFGTGEPLPPPVTPEPGGTTTPLLPAELPPDPGAVADFNAARARFDAGDRAGRARRWRPSRPAPASTRSSHRRSDAGPAGAPAR